MAATLANGECSLTDGSSPGDWRLPTKDEWSATFARAIALGCTYPPLTNDAGTACFPSGAGSSFAAVVLNNYWSSSTDEANPNIAWMGSLFHGAVFIYVLFKVHPLPVWPVRSGSR